MKRITAYEWRGQVFTSQRDATKAIDEAYGEIITRHAHAICRIDKIMDAIEYLEKHCEDIAKAAQLKNEMRLENPEEELE